MLRKIASLLAPDPAVNPPAGGAPATSPATTPVTPPVEPKPELKIDPMVKEIADSFGLVLEPEPAPKEKVPVPDISMGEMAAKLVTKPAETPPAPAAAPIVPAPAAPAPPAEPPAPKLKVVPKPVPAPVIPAPVVAPAPVVPAPAAPAIDDDYVKNLSPEQQYELQVMEYSGKDGIKAKMVDYYKKWDEFLAKDPDIDVDGNEAKKFISDNRPNFTQAEFRQAERKLVVEEAKAEVRKEMEPELQEQQRQLRAIQSAPRIQATVDATRDQIVGQAEAISPECAKAIQEKGVDGAAEEFTIEVPIIQDHLAAVQSWESLRSGVTQFNDQDPMQSFLLQFVTREGANVSQQPKEVKTLPDGRTFLPMHEYNQLVKADQANRAKYWTFDDPHPKAIKVSELLAEAATIRIKNELARLEKGGFKRQKAAATEKVSTANGNQPPVVTPPTTTTQSSGGGSPRATGNPLPGAGDGVPPSNPSFVDELVPGWSQTAGLK